MANRTQNPPLGPSFKIWQRETANGRRLQYELKVIQQPERARACGAGAKSSADRRPVDPPPVVELKIYEENPNTGGRDDITFSYEANFFLFATLEVARPVAHARGQAPQQVPVLTGMPVSGMAYLDRPTEAGYFIFPDLSVRHEGIYRLSFNLYEETKHSDDFDKESSGENKPKVAGPAPDASFDWRMEVKSDLFTVYSAKKFPGLAESTSLSRTVAEQGCRVRIRRDVRMRRREGKANGDFDEVLEDEYRQGRPVEQEPYRERSRSTSNGSEEGRSQYQDPQNPHYQNLSFSGSPATQHATAHGQHLSFLGPQGPQFSQPGPPAHVQHPTPQTTYYAPAPPGPPAYQHNPAYSAQPPPLQPPNKYFDNRQHPSSAYPSNPPREPEVFDGMYRRASSSTVYSHHRGYPDLDTGYNRLYQAPAPLSQTPSSAQPPQLAPLKLPDSQHETLHSPLAPFPSFNRSGPPIASPIHERTPERTSMLYSHFKEPAPTLQPSLSASDPTRSRGKRGYGEAFKSPADNEPLYNGMRPGSSNGRGNDDVSDEESIVIPLSYKRADGSEQSRELPTAQANKLQ